MAVTYGSIKQLANTFLHATESVVYQTPASTYTEVSSLWVHNSSGDTLNAKAYWPQPDTPTGSFSGSLELERLSESFSGSATLEISPKVPFVLNGNTNDSLTMVAANSGSLTVIVYGREGTGTP